MELGEFVKQSLIQIDRAIREADEVIDRGIFYSGTHDTRSVEFDIAVMVESKKSKTGEIGIKVIELMSIGGGSLQSDITNTSVSRIKFGVHFSKDGNPITTQTEHAPSVVGGDKKEL